MDKDGIAIDLNSGNALEVFRNLQHEDHVPRFLLALRRQPLRHTSVVRFGTYEVSLQSGEVRKAGVKIRVQQQPMKLLEILLERPGEVVTREELRGRVWADESFGDFDQAVNIAIGKLRSALGDSAENPRYIETLPKRGYRFIAEVSVVAEDDRIKKPESATGDYTWDRALGIRFKAPD